VLALRRPGAGSDLPYAMARAGIIYIELHVYSVVETPDWHRRALLQPVDYVVATSSQIARGIARAGSPLTERVISIGPITTRELQRLGIKPLCTSHVSSLEGVAACLYRMAGKKRG
jgi:uroporphyrinogen III methyltransferase/synthase